jgi:hypothetical protein
MKGSAAGLSFFLIALFGTQALAATTAQRFATITGTATGAATNQCDQGYSNQCPTSSCTCVQIPGAVVGKVPGQLSIAGSGTANVFLTLDNGAATPSAIGNCTPFFGVAELTTTRGGKPSSETLNLTGVLCAPLTTANRPILGGFGISASPKPTNGGKGFGKFAGTMSPSSVVSLTLHGPITE